MIKSLNRILIVLFFMIGIYHILICANKMGVLELTKDQLFNYIYPIHNICQNGIIVTLIIYLIKSCIFRKIFYIFISYPALKIIYNICLFISVSRSFVRSIDINIYLLLLVGSIVIILLVLRLMKY